MRAIIFHTLLFLFICSGCKHSESSSAYKSIIAAGHAPSMVQDRHGRLHIAYCEGDSIMYVYSSTGGKTFSAPALVSLLPGLASSHARGPQIAVSGQQLTIIAGNKSGNIFSFAKKGESDWLKTARVNDRDSTSKEELMSLHGDGHGLYAVWLDLRTGHNQIYGSALADGGASWTENMLIYASPDSTVCECCRPSVAVKDNHVYVMFRNLINGNRDLYLLQSDDGGKNFGPAQKLGTGSWKLNGCPMDGGGLVIDDQGMPQTVSRREDKVYSCEPGKPEKEIATGRSCSMAIAGGKNIYVWTEKGEVMCMLSPDKKQDLGKGNLPIVRTTNNHNVVCVWEQDKQLHAAVMEL